MTKKEKVFYGRILHFSKKIMAINYLGGKCIKCNENNVLKLTFHPGIQQRSLMSTFMLKRLVSHKNSKSVTLSPAVKPD